MSSRLFKLLPCLPFLLFLLLAVSPAQDLEELYRLYGAHALAELEKRLSTLPQDAEQIPDIVFFRTVFDENGEEAARIYEQLFEASDGWLKKVTADKLAQYHYARGYYVKAADFAAIAEAAPARLDRNPVLQRKPDTTPPADRTQIQEYRYAIQVGAFGYRDNAEKMLDLLNKQRLEARIVKREVNGKTLFCVWIDGQNDREKTQEYARELKEKYNIPYRVVETQ